MKIISDSLEFSFHKVRNSVNKVSKRSFVQYAYQILTCLNWDCLLLYVTILEIMIFRMSDTVQPSAIVIHVH